MRSAFGIEHGEISKGRAADARRRKMGRAKASYMSAVKTAEDAKAFKKPGLFTPKNLAITGGVGTAAGLGTLAMSRKKKS